jgi:hypothetical protein
LDENGVSIAFRSYGAYIEYFAHAYIVTVLSSRIILAVARIEFPVWDKNWSLARLIIPVRAWLPTQQLVSSSAPLVLLHPGGRSRIFAYLRGPCIKKVHSRCIRFQPGTVAEAFPKADSEPNFPKDLGQFCDRAPIMTEADRVSCLRLQERNQTNCNGVSAIESIPSIQIIREEKERSCPGLFPSGSCAHHF